MRLLPAIIAAHNALISLRPPWTLHEVFEKEDTPAGKLLSENFLAQYPGSQRDCRIWCGQALAVCGHVVYIIDMLRYGIIIFACALCACGPKEIGEGTSYKAETRPQATAADVMRLPMAGMNNTQRMLYWYNNPDVMVNLQQARMQYYKRQMGISPENPEYRAVPAQRSPFRQ